MSKDKNRVNVVYSTNSNYQYDNDADDIVTLKAEEQELKVQIDRKQRKGKSVTLVTGFIGTIDDIKNLSKELKSKCGGGGTFKDDEILIQGNFKEKIFDLLIEMGYSKTKKVGG